MEDVVHMNFGSVQLYIGKAAVKKKVAINKKSDTKLPPIGDARHYGTQLGN